MEHLPVMSQCDLLLNLVCGGIRTTKSDTKTTHVTNNSISILCSLLIAFVSKAPLPTTLSIHYADTTVSNKNHKITNTHVHTLNTSLSS